MARTRSKTNGYTLKNKVRIIRGGIDYFDAIEEIADNAQYSLHLQTYIFDENETGKRVAEALMRAAQRGVYVYMLLDGYASQHLSDAFIARLRDAGIHFRFFEPFLKSKTFYFGRRLHHKLVVADAHICLVAGINVSDRYNDIGNTHAWLDWAVRVEGEAAADINEVCVRMWDRAVFHKKCMATKNPAFPLPEEECAVRIRRNDWVYKRVDITRTYRELFMHAHGHVTMMTSYFWPPQKLLKRMAAASRRGVKIKLILTATADVPLAKYTERYLYSWLFRNNIEVYEYQANVLHGKAAVCDNEWLTAGSYNVNNISANASVELNLDVRQPQAATRLNDMMQAIIDKDCRRITEADFLSSNNMIKRFLYYLAYRATHTLFFLFTFYFIQRRENS